MASQQQQQPQVSSPLTTGTPFTPQRSQQGDEDEDDFLTTGNSDAKVWKYRREKYLEAQVNASNFIIKPFFIAFSAAIGFSVGYAVFDFFASFFKRRRQ
nr:unnamed protein product [Naegleria fowleri]